MGSVLPIPALLLACTLRAGVGYSEQRTSSTAWLLDLVPKYRHLSCWRTLAWHKASGAIEGASPLAESLGVTKRLR